MFRALRHQTACLLIIAIGAAAASDEPRRALVLLSDFGTTERFVASMKGVALDVDANLQVHDLTHHIEPFNIWQASFVLAGTIEYWPTGTVFVSVVDPGVGTERKSVVAKTGSGHFIVTPDNGSLTLVADKHGIVELREIDESTNRRPGTDEMHTFHGRDVYAYTGARLAAGDIEFTAVGPSLAPKVEKFNYQQPRRLDDVTVIGNIVHVEVPFGNIVTNIPGNLVKELGVSPQDGAMMLVNIFRASEQILKLRIPFVPSFGHVAEGEPLLYSDSLQTLGLAVNSGSFAERFDVHAGAEWEIRLSKIIVSD